MEIGSGIIEGAIVIYEDTDIRNCK